MSPRLAKALDALFVEHQIVALRDKFPANVTDVDWITALDREGGWTVVTKDIGIRQRPHERAAAGRQDRPFDQCLRERGEVGASE